MKPETARQIMIDFTRGVMDRIPHFYLHFIGTRRPGRF